MDDDLDLGSDDDISGLNDSGAADEAGGDGFYVPPNPGPPPSQHWVDLLSRQTMLPQDLSRLLCACWSARLVL